MNCFATRFAVWLITLAAYPIPVQLFPQSFAVEVLERIAFSAPPLAALPQERPRVDLTEHVLVYLENAERKEINPWLRDDYRIAWITTNWSDRGIPDWFLRDRSSAYVAATYQVLNCHPDQVWPNIVAARRRQLGNSYEQVWASSPKKPAKSVTLEEFARRKAA